MSISIFQKRTQSLVGVVNTFNNVLPTITKDVMRDIQEMIPLLRKWMITTLYKTVPVRTGRLLDTILQTLRIDMFGNTLTLHAVVATGYPLVIRNPKHSGQIGWGPMYFPKHPIPNRVILRTTKKGAYYILNDPTAVGEYTTILKTYVFPMVRDIIPTLLSNYEVNIILPKIKKDPALLTGDPASVEFVMDMAKIYTGGGPITSEAISAVFTQLRIIKWKMNDVELRALWDRIMADRAIGQKFYKKYGG